MDGLCKRSLGKRTDALSRRPSHGAAAQQMKMQMENRLASFRACVDDNSVAGKSDSLLIRQALGDQEQAAYCEVVSFLDAVKRLDMLLGNYKRMARGFGTEVLEGQTQRVLIQDLGWQLPLNDSTKNTTRHK
jgi:hypothetical protein